MACEMRQSCSGDDDGVEAVPPAFLCPILQDVMRDPVITARAREQRRAMRKRRRNKKLPCADDVWIPHRRLTGTATSAPPSRTGCACTPPAR
jgi:hypothetical protein